ncbi:MAG TPA: DUF2812 domain-containing protein [Anaerolineaceae bacterium]|nr:DUF2812 domain-containing protein [Anaerolineaceae bacterium]
MSDKKIVLFSVFRHVVPADYENWLEQMAAEGWHINKIGQWDSVFMSFQRGIPKKVRFVYDPQVSPRSDYIPTYEQFGWEYLGCMASAHIWRMEYEGERPQAFSDQEGLADRNRRNMIALSVSMVLFLVTVIVLGLSLRFASDSLSNSDRNQLVIAAIFFGTIFLALGYFMLQMWKNRSR